MLLATKGLSKEQLWLLKPNVTVSQLTKVLLANQRGQQHCCDDGPTGPPGLNQTSQWWEKSIRDTRLFVCKSPEGSPEKDKSLLLSICVTLEYYFAVMLWLWLFHFIWRRLFFIKYFFSWEKVAKCPRNKTMIHVHPDLNHKRRKWNLKKRRVHHWILGLNNFKNLSVTLMINAKRGTKPIKYISSVALVVKSNLWSDESR